MKNKKPTLIQDLTLHTYIKESCGFTKLWDDLSWPVNDLISIELRGRLFNEMFKLSDLIKDDLTKV